MESSGAFPASPRSNSRPRAHLPRRPSSTFSWGEALGPATFGQGRASSYPRAHSSSRSTNHAAGNNRRATSNRGSRSSRRAEGGASNRSATNIRKATSNTRSTSSTRSASRTRSGNNVRSGSNTRSGIYRKDGSNVKATSHSRAASQDNATTCRGATSNRGAASNREATSQYGASVRMVVQDSVGEEITDISDNVKEADEIQVEAEMDATIIKPVKIRQVKKKRLKKCTKEKFTDFEETEVPAWSCLDAQENGEQKSVWVAENVKYNPAKKGEVQEPNVRKAQNSETIEIYEDREASQQTNSKINWNDDGMNLDGSADQEHNYCVTKSVKSLKKTIKIKHGTPRKLSLSEQKVANQRTFNRTIKLASTTAGTPYFTCCLCNSPFISRSDALRHAVSQSQHKTSRGVKEVECPVCDQRFHGLVALNRHAGLQHPYTRTCSKCNIKVKTKKGFMKHIKFCGSPDPKLFSCNLCQFTTNFKYNLNSHKKIHSKIPNEFSFSPVSKDRKGANQNKSAIVIESSPTFEAIVHKDKEIVVAHNSVCVTRFGVNTNLLRPISKKITHELPFVIGGVAAAASRPVLAISGDTSAMITNLTDKVENVRSELTILKMIFLPQVSSLAVMTRLSVTVYSLGDETEARMKIEVEDEDALQDLTATVLETGVIKKLEQQDVSARQEVHIVMLHDSGRMAMKNICDDTGVKELHLQGDPLPVGVPSRSVFYHNTTSCLVVGFQDHICLIPINESVNSLLTVTKVVHPALDPVGWTDLKENIVLFRSSGLPYQMDVTTGAVQPLASRPQSVVAGMCTVAPGEALLLFQDSSVHLVNCEVASTGSSSSVYSSLVAYICVLCGDDFRDAYHHSKHIKMHEVAFSECDICELSFKDKIYMSRHRSQCFMKCNYCKFQSKYYSKINAHMKSSRCNK